MWYAGDEDNPDDVTSGLPEDDKEDDLFEEVNDDEDSLDDNPDPEDDSVS